MDVIKQLSLLKNNNAEELERLKQELEEYRLRCEELEEEVIPDIESKNESLLYTFIMGIIILHR